jgi:porin
MTGDWGGLRTRLSQDGFGFRASYIGKYAYSFSGGKRIGGDYAQQFAVGK